MATLVTARAGSALPLSGHVSRTLALALPVMLARSGLLVMAAVDTIMAGRAGSEQLAFYAVAMAPQIMLVLVGIGLMMGTVVLTAQSDGAGRPHLCGRIWRLALINAVVLGVAFGMVLLGGAWLLRILAQPEGLVEGGAGVLRMFAPGLPGLFLFVATSFFLEGIGRVRPGMVVMIGANVLNFGLNWLLMVGPWQLGAEGAALGTTLTRWVMAVAMIGYVLTMRDRRTYGTTGPLVGHWYLERSLIRLGLPLSLSFGLEHGAFMAVVVMAGWLGAVPVAAYQVNLNVMALIYMSAIGIATATAVRVGNAVGRGDQPGLGIAGWVGVGIGLVLMLAIAPLLIGGRDALVGIYTADPAVIAIAAPGMVLVALALLGDASQGILMGALRGAADVWAPLGLQLASFWVVAVPLAYLLAFEFGHGVPGLLAGLATGLSLAAVLLTARFAAVARRPVRPV